MSDLRTIDSKNLIARLAQAVLILIAIYLAWYAISWQFGNLLATLTQETDPNLTEVAAIATRWAPSDPAAHALKAASLDPAGAIASLETAVRNAPHDFRWRTELGSALEQDDQLVRAEEQLKIAVELAPTYAAPRWHLGNFYLRQEQLDKAFAELRLAAENDHRYREQVFSLVWDSSGRDPGQLEKIAGEKPEMLARLAYFFAARGRADDSLRNWNRLGSEDKRHNTPLARSIALGLFDQKHFPQALEFGRQYGAETDATAETVTNGGFEQPVGETNDSRFGWVIERSDPKFEAAPDSRVKREGNRSLRGTFKGYSKTSFSNLLQTIVVQPNTKYELSFWVRSENLRSSGLPILEVVNANDNNGIARSTSFSLGTDDWRRMTVDFTTPANCTGVLIRTIRDFCGEDCPITGIFWYDSFEMTRR